MNFVIFGLDLLQDKKKKNHMNLITDAAERIYDTSSSLTSR